MNNARIIFVPGLSPKPPAEVYRAQLLRVLLAALRRARPRAASMLAAQPDAFVLVAWTHFFYGADRDISLDLAGIERLLTQEATPEDRREHRVVVAAARPRRAHGRRRGAAARPARATPRFARSSTT